MKETVIEYETVEKERERTLCDECGAEADHPVTVAVNPLTLDPARLLRDLDDARHTTTEWFGTEDFVSYNRREVSEMGPDASETLDWCYGCTTEKLGYEIPLHELPTGPVSTTEAEAPPMFTPRELFLYGAAASTGVLGMVGAATDDMFTVICLVVVILAATLIALGREIL